ncbi:MAG: InlB B-repeat-containing protein [Clostridia bacterium]|nr:InlB B-repeat-containing protein [Clostridia bacterium]
MLSVKRAISIVLILIMALSPCLAAGRPLLPASAQADSDFDGIPDANDAQPTVNVFTGAMKSSHDDTTSVSFTADFRNFFEDSTVYQPDLASFSVMGSALAYYNVDPGDSDPTYMRFASAPTVESSAVQYDGMQLMTLFGFADVADFTLDSYDDDDVCEMVIGHRLYEYAGETKEIIAIWVRGTEPKSEKEWSSNFHVGDLVRFFDAYDSAEGKSPRQSNDDWTRKTNHRGFDVCATRLLNYLKTYYFDEYVAPELALEPEAALAYWLTGHSRGAAVANLMASYLIDEGNEVFAYTYAAPNNTANTEASAERYDCIFNLVNANDFVPMLPMVEWGFTRFGKTAVVDASQWSSQIQSATGSKYDGNYLSASDMTTLLGKFICITGENADRSNPGKILGWREVYVYHCGHDHADETNGDHQSTTFCKKQSITNWGGPTESGYNGYAVRLRKYSYWHDGICETPAYCMQVLVELMVAVANGETLGGASTFITSNKLADKFDFDKWSLISYATKLTEPHFMDTYSVIQAQINAAGDPGARFSTMKYYTAENEAGGRPVHTHAYTYVPYEGHEPTCTEDGLGYRYCLCSEANADFYDDYQKNVTIPALGHSWGEPEYSWSEDHASCTAARTCARDAEHIETETAGAVYEIVIPPTLYAEGLGRWTAVFENEAFAAQTIDEAIPMIPGFTVRFVDWDGSLILEQRVEAGGAATAPEPPERDGYTFIGWDGDYSCVTQDITVTALYEQVHIGTNRLGDVNCDGSVDFEDVSALAGFIVHACTLTEQGMINADLDGSGAVSSLDISYLYNFLLNVTQ